MATLMAVNFGIALVLLVVGLTTGCAPVKETAVTPATVDAYVASMKETALLRKEFAGLSPIGTDKPLRVRVTQRAYDSSSLRDIEAAVEMVNEAMPEHRQLVVYRCPDPVCGERNGAILLDVAKRQSEMECGRAQTLGCGGNNGLGRGHVVLSPRLKAETSQRQRGVIVHELLHALGIAGHPDATLFPDSIMASHVNAKGRDMKGTNATGIAPIDAAVLRSMYPAKGVQSAHLDQ